jgi:hypothetical protein
VGVLVIVGVLVGVGVLVRVGVLVNCDPEVGVFVSPQAKFDEWLDSYGAVAAITTNTAMKSKARRDVKVMNLLILASLSILQIGD